MGEERDEELEALLARLLLLRTEERKIIRQLKHYLSYHGAKMQIEDLGDLLVQIGMSEKEIKVQRDAGEKVGAKVSDGAGQGEDDAASSEASGS